MCCQLRLDFKAAGDSVVHYFVSNSSRALHRCKHDLAPAPPFGTLVRCSTHGHSRSYMCSPSSSALLFHWSSNTLMQHWLQNISTSIVLTSVACTIFAPDTYMCSPSSSTLLSSNVVPVAAEWDWSERLSGMGCEYNFLQVHY